MSAVALGMVLVVIAQWGKVRRLEALRAVIRK